MAVNLGYNKPQFTLPLTSKMAERII